MRPVIAIVGRPNVGKSTLYNRLTRSRDALVDDQPGVTRDRLIGVGRAGDQVYWVIDTGGITADNDALQRLLREQIDLALAEADAIIFMVDGRDGPNVTDREIAAHLRVQQTPLYLAVNKTEGIDRDLAILEFFDLGLGKPYAISARTGTGVKRLVDSILDQIPGTGSDDVLSKIPHFAIMGRPNVGKSTLANVLLGEKRMLVFDEPGTTRDSVNVPFQFEDKDYMLVDTAGLRRRSRIVERLEQFSAVKALRTLDQVHVVVLVLDAQQGVVEQDARLTGLVWSSGRSMVLVVNKWDHLDTEQRRRVRLDVERKLSRFGQIWRRDRCRHASDPCRVRFGNGEFTHPAT
jgi:GTP-binding protein